MTLTAIRMFVRRPALAAALTIASALPVAAQRSVADSYPARCGASVFPAEQGGYVALPRGDVFCPLIADPKAMRSFVAYQKGNETDLATNIAAVGVADQFHFSACRPPVEQTACRSGLPARCSRSST